MPANSLAIQQSAQPARRSSPETVAVAAVDVADDDFLVQEKSRGQAVLAPAPGDFSGGIECPSHMVETGMHFEKFANLGGFVHGDHEDTNAISQLPLNLPQIIEVFPARHTPSGEKFNRSNLPGKPGPVDRLSF